MSYVENLRSIKRLDKELYWRWFVIRDRVEIPSAIKKFFLPLTERARHNGSLLPAFTASEKRIKVGLVWNKDEVPGILEPGKYIPVESQDESKNVITNCIWFPIDTREATLGFVLRPYVWHIVEGLEGGLDLSRSHSNITYRWWFPEPSNSHRMTKHYELNTEFHTGKKLHRLENTKKCIEILLSLSREEGIINGWREIIKT